MSRYIAVTQPPSTGFELPVSSFLSMLSKAGNGISMIRVAIHSSGATGWCVTHTIQPRECLHRLTAAPERIAERDLRARLDNLAPKWPVGGLR